MRTLQASRNSSLGIIVCLCVRVFRQTLICCVYMLLLLIHFWCRLCLVVRCFSLAHFCSVSLNFVFSSFNFHSCNLRRQSFVAFLWCFVSSTPLRFFWFSFLFSTLSLFIWLVFRMRYLCLIIQFLDGREMGPQERGDRSFQPLLFTLRRRLCRSLIQFLFFIIFSSSQLF